MNFPEPNEVSRAILQFLSAIAILFLLLTLVFLLAACTVCPDETCPTFPTAAPRQ